MDNHPFRVILAPVPPGQGDLHQAVSDNQPNLASRACRPIARLDLLDLPHDYLDTLVQHHLPGASLASIRATCRQLKVLADRRLSHVTVPFDSMLRHSFWRTGPLPTVTSLVLEMPGIRSAAGVGGSVVVSGCGGGEAAGAAAAGNLPSGAAPQQTVLPLGHQLPLFQPPGLVWQKLQPVQLLQQQPSVSSVSGTAAQGPTATAAAAPPPPPTPPQPLPVLLPPVTFAGLRRHLPGLRHLTLRNVYFPREETAAAAAAAAPAAAAPSDYPLDLSGLRSLSLEGLWPRAGAAWRMQGVNPFPLGLVPSLSRAASSLVSLSLTHVTFEGGSGDVLGLLTGLEELTIRSCNNFTTQGLTVLGQLTRLTHLAYVDVFYRTGIPQEMAVLSSLTRLRSANFSRCDLYAEEVVAWAAWGPTLTRLEMSSRWQMTLDAVPQLLPHLTSLEHLDLADHCLDRRMWRLISARMPRLASARFSWVNLPDEEEDEEVEEVEDDDPEGYRGWGEHVEGGGGGGGGRGLYGGGGGANGMEEGPDVLVPLLPGGGGGGDLLAAAAGPAAGPGGVEEGEMALGLEGPGVPVGAGAAGQRSGELRPIESLRHLRLDGPWEGDECDRRILSLLPHLEELRIGDDAAALAAIAEDDPGVYDRLERWPVTSSMLSLPADAAAAAAAAPPLPRHPAGAAGGSLRLLSAPASWLQSLLRCPFPNLRTLRVHSVRPGSGGAAAAVAAGAAAAVAAQRPPSASALLSEAQLRASWRLPLVSLTAAPWAQLTALDVPRDLDAAALAPLCRDVRHLQISQSYGDGLLALASMAGPARPLPRLQEVTLAGALWSCMDPEAYHCALLLALAARRVQRVRVTRGSGLLGGWWARSRERLRRTLEAEQLVWPEVVLVSGEGEGAHVV